MTSPPRPTRSVSRTPHTKHQTPDSHLQTPRSHLRSAISNLQHANPKNTHPTSSTNHQDQAEWLQSFPFPVRNRCCTVPSRRARPPTVHRLVRTAILVKHLDSLYRGAISAFCGLGCHPSTRPRIGRRGGRWAIRAALPAATRKRQIFAGVRCILPCLPPFARERAAVRHSVRVGQRGKYCTCPVPHVVKPHASPILARPAESSVAPLRRPTSIDARFPN